MITNLTITNAGTLAWRLAWEGDDPDATYRIFRDGLLVSTTPLTEVIVGVSPETAPVFEVLDDPDADPSDGFPATATLAWYQAAGTLEYRVEELVSAVWTELAVVTDGGAPYYRWTSERLGDGSSHTYRVVPVGTNGNDGTPVEFAVLMVRVPDPPDFTLEYFSGAHLVTFDLV